MYGDLVFSQWICLESGLYQEVIRLLHCWQQRCCAPGHRSIHCGCEPSVGKQGFYYYVSIMSSDQAHLCIFVYTGNIANYSHLGIELVTQHALC